MDDPLQWLLAVLGLFLLAGWLGYRWLKGAASRHKSGLAIAAAAAKAEVQRIADEELAHRQVAQRVAARRAAQVEAVRLARAEAVRAETARLAAEAAARATAASLAAAQASRVERARRASEEAARAAAARAPTAGMDSSDQAARMDGVGPATEQNAQDQNAQDTRERLGGPAANENRRGRDDTREMGVGTVRFPDSPQTTPPAGARPATTFAAKTPEQTNIMVADDSKVVRVKTGRLLAQHQYRVSYATDGLDAASQMLADVPDIVITDVEMPGMDGFELTRYVRQNPLTAHVPVIMITAADDKHREDAIAAGVNVLLGKPYAEEELIAQIQLAMNKRGFHVLARSGTRRPALNC